MWCLSGHQLQRDQYVGGVGGAKWKHIDGMLLANFKKTFALMPIKNKKCYNETEMTVKTQQMDNIEIFYDLLTMNIISSRRAGGVFFEVDRLHMQPGM